MGNRGLPQTFKRKEVLQSVGVKSITCSTKGPWKGNDNTLRSSAEKNFRSGF